MAFKEVMEMRKQDAVKAYEMALNDYQGVQNDWTRRALAWCIFDAMKVTATYSQKDLFIPKLQELASIELSANDTMVWGNMVWPISAFVRDCVKISHPQEDILTEVFNLIKEFPFVKPSKEYSVLLNAFVKAKNWRNINNFCDWWDFSNFREEDFECDIVNGRKMPTSLAENAHLAYARTLLALRDMDGIAAFLPKLQEFSDKHPDMMFPNYYRCKLLLATGNNGENTLATILPFVRKKKTEFWAWQLLAEIFVNDNEKHLACLLRAVNCRTKEEFLVRIYLMLAKIFRGNGHYADARYYLDKHIQVKNNTQTRISDEVYAMKSESWYNEAANQQPSFAIDYMAITDDLLFHDVKETYAVVSFVNTDKKIANVIYGKEKTGYFKYDRFMKNVRVGDALNIRIDSITPEGRMNLYSAKKADNAVETDFYKTFSGSITSNHAQTAFFLNVEGESCYIPSNFISKNNLNVGDEISVLALYSYNKNKDSWGWSCVKVMRNVNQ